MTGARTVSYLHAEPEEHLPDSSKVVSPEHRIPRTSHQVMDKMQRIADANYHGAIRENIIEIFDQLHPVDRQTFLRKCMILYWENDIDHTHAALSDIRIDSDTSIDLDIVRYERKDLKELDVAEQIKLKTWLNKAFVIFGAVFFVGIFLASAVFGLLDMKKVSETLDSLTAIFNILGI